MSKAVRRQYKTGSVFQRKDGMWIGRFEAGKDRNGNRRQITVSATSEPACKVKLEEKKREVARAGVPEKRAGKQDTVAAWSAEWLKIIVTEQRPKAYATTASTVKNWIVPSIGRKRLVNLTPADIRSVFDAQRKAGLADSSRLRTHSNLMQMLKAAKLEGHDVPERIFLVKKPQVGETDREAVPVQDAVRMLQHVADDPDGSTWAAALLQGMRQGERLGLTWDCVDFDERVIDISWQLQPLPYIDNRNKALGFRVPDGYRAIHLERAYHLVRPKSAKSRRSIPLIEPMENALRAWRELSPHSSHGLVWPDANGGPRAADDDRAAWKAIQEALGIRHPAGRHYHLHEARHATVTVLRQLGIDKDTVEAIIGHSKLIESYDHSDRMPAMRTALESAARRLALGS